jgi:hypothetical protein
VIASLDQHNTEIAEDLRHWEAIQMPLIKPAAEKQEDPSPFALDDRIIF